MLQSLYTGGHGMHAQQQSIDNIANNIANISTNGYKKTRLEFSDALYARMISPTDNAPNVNLQRGTGVLAYQNARDFTQGPIQNTGRPLDFALEGSGFFQVTDETGAIHYTRDGTFYLSIEPGGDYLVNANGGYVLDTTGARIGIPGSLADLSVGADGTLYTKNAAGDPVAFARFGLYDFTNPTGLTDTGANRFMPSANSGAPVAAAPGVRQGSLEGSNVDYGEEVSRIIRAQRAYQLASRCVATADRMSQTLNSVRT